ncbi:MAG: DNA polymerase III subunit alpha [Acidobacteriota bacterium]|jgi:DNA polymerase-3 subunit alpha|nr:DNA polymerase III subunit alpha [Acidobacteriota bacterium]
MNRFIHLHLHSEFSLLDSCLKIKPLIQRVKEFNMPAVALTDHGNILGAVGFFKEAQNNDVKPIIGCELYVAPESMDKKPDHKNGRVNYHHLVVLVKNEKGYRNLCELITRSYLEGFYRRPRVDKHLLSQCHEGLVVLSACIQGEIPYWLLLDRWDNAREAANWYRETFGDDFYIEIQNHGLRKQREVLPKLVELARSMDIPLVASNDVHYIRREEADAREILICLQTNDVLSNPDRAMHKETDEMYLKSGAEMREVFPDLPDSLDITLDIASKCQFEFKLGTYYLPEFKVPEPQSIDGYFEQICREGFETLKGRLNDKKHEIATYSRRLEYEIEKIREMGFPGYFLIVWDIIRFARERGIFIGPGRGSVVGSLVAYTMGITGIDPMDYDLIFERFLNPERISMPDIDIDFDPERRDEVIQYIRERYGDDSVAQIVTFGRMKAKLAIRDIGRVLEIPLGTVNQLAKLIPDGPGVDLQSEIKQNNELRREINRIEKAPELMDYALKLENNVRHTSMHAAGVVIAPRKLTEFMPLYKTRDDIVTQFEKEEVEQIGLLKLDILGLKTLTIIKNILQALEEREQIHIDLDRIPLDDRKTFKIFQAGDTDGIFQFESSGMRDYLKRSKPKRIEDLIVLNGLYRPGPLKSGMADAYVNRKLGREKVKYIFPELEEILKDTYGIIVFQEQVMRISVDVAGFAMSKADEMRKIMGKKQVEKIPAMEKSFVEGAMRKGHARKQVEELFSQMATFAEYGFNKSHSTAYAYLAYQTAYLKAHFPVYFMAAHLSSEAEKTSTSSKVIQYISECKKMGFEVLKPDINRSFMAFSVDSANAIRFGLKGLKNIGESALQSILDARKTGSDFKDFSDFMTRIDLTRVNKTVLESLIKSGALDCFGISRKVLFDSLEDAVKQALMIEKRRDTQQKSLFMAEEEVLQVTIPPQILAEPEWGEKELIQFEKEIAGIYITHNPLEKFRNEISRVSNTTIAAILNHEFSGETVRLGGVITNLKQRKSRRGDMYGELYFEDLTGRVKVFAFKDRWAEIRDSLELDTPCLLEGRLPQANESDITIYLETLTDMEALMRRKARQIVIKVRYEQLSDEFNADLKERLERNRDSVPYVIMVYRNDGYRTSIQSAEGDGLRATVSMKRDLERLTGENSVEIVY